MARVPLAPSPPTSGAAEAASGRSQRLVGTSGAVVLFGKADDAPGLVLLGILLIVSACALSVRAAQHSS